MERVFINHTNHSSSDWSVKQRKEAEKFGKIKDYPFPVIDPEWDKARVLQLVQESCVKILAMRPVAVLCQGEFTYCHHLINQLKKHGILVLSACSKRETVEWDEDSVHIKKAKFSFVRFREY